MRHGFDLAQGFYFSKPLTVYELNNLSTYESKFTLPEMIPYLAQL